eukprot:136503_1
MNSHYVSSKKYEMNNITNTPSLSRSPSNKSNKSNMSIRSNRSNRSIKRYKFSDLRWIESASPPSTLPNINSDDGMENFDEYIDYNNNNKPSMPPTSKLRINVSNYRKSTTSLSGTSQNSYHRTSVAEMLNIETPSALCTPYTPYNTQPTPFTPRAMDMKLDDDADDEEEDDDDDDDDDEEEDEEEYIEEMDSRNESKIGINDFSKPRYSAVTQFGFFVMSLCFLIHFASFQ